jgi:hypothetical protein
MPISIDTDRAESLVMSLPDIYANARDSWAKFKAGYDAGLFSQMQAEKIIDHYRQWPKFWEGLRPNFFQGRPGWPEQPGLKALGSRVDIWIDQLKKDLGGYERLSGLGAVPVIVVAGILIAAAFGAGFLVWALGFKNQQANISSIIDAVVDGELPAEVLTKAIETEKTSGFVADIAGAVKWIMLGAAGFVLLPKIANYFKKEGR